MIGRLKGVLVHKQPPFLMVDVSGVGYELEAPMSTFFELPQTGEAITLLTHFVVREDAQLLYGFASEAERALFRALIKVNGIGAKVALAILSGISSDDFALCVAQEDVATLTKIPGIGKKTAERLCVELKDKVDGLTGGTPMVKLSPQVQTAGKGATVEALEALVALGYKEAESLKLIKAVETDEMTAEEIIRAALQGAFAK